MKKVININFQGRVIPIEETAYEILQQYIESLRKYFSNEEGRDEIINDIEGRIAELFSDRLKKGVTCITDEDVNAVITSMGRPEDFEKAEETAGFQQASADTSKKQTHTGSSHQQVPPAEARRLYRSENDRILGGVCSGLANYLRIDPAIVRIVFALITLGGFGLGFIIYILMWIILPSNITHDAARKRLYRNPENKVIGGVASGLAAYFRIDVWIPRLIFAAPLLVSVIVSIFRNAWFDFDPGPVFVTGGFGGTLFITYIILWIVLPEANTASEKLEMRGERVDLQSIKNTVKGDLENFKTKAHAWGQEVKETAQHYANQAGPAARSFASEAGPVVRRTGSGIGHAIGVLFKAFFLFISGMLAFAMLMALIGLLLGGFAFFPFKDFLLDGFWQNFFAWSTLIFFLGIPIIAFLTWLVRRIIGVKTKTHYLGYVFGTLWVFGLVSLIILGGMIARNFKTKASVKTDIAITQPTSGKLTFDVTDERVKYYGDDWFGFDNSDWPFYSMSEDSILMNTIRLRIVRSPDSSFHVYEVKFSNGNNPGLAQRLASEIRFDVTQRDSLIYLPKGFTINKGQKFRNQQVMLVVEVPLGKRVQIDRNVDQYEWFNVNFGRRRGWNIEWDNNWDNSFYYNTDVEYRMTPEGLERTDKKDKEEEGSAEEQQKIRAAEDEKKGKPTYKYKGTDSTQQKKDTLKQTAELLSDPAEDETPYPAFIYMLSRIAR